MSTSTAGTAPTPVADAPRARPAASGVALVLGLALVGVAVVAVHDLSVDQGWSGGPSWTGRLLDGLDGLTAGTPVVVAGVTLALVGLWLVVLAVKPAARTHRAAPGTADVWVTPRAVRALASAAAEDTPGVAAATTRHRRGRLVVRAQADRPDVAPHVERAVRSAVEGLTPTTDVVIRTEEVKHRDA